MNCEVVTGFLGAGKTTYILKILADHKEQGKIAVIVNDFGELDIDGQVVQQATALVKELPQGCICCSLQAELPLAMAEIEKKYQPERLIIEPSGIASPEHIIKIFEHYYKQSPWVLTCLVSAETFKLYRENFGDFFKQQIACAGQVILNKADTVSPEELWEIEVALMAINPQALILTARHGVPQAAEVTRRPLPQPAPASGYVEASSVMHQSFETTTLLFGQKVTIEELNKAFDAVRAGQAGDILRAKGFLTLDQGFKKNRL